MLWPRVAPLLTYKGAIQLKYMSLIKYFTSALLFLLGQQAHSEVVETVVFNVKDNVATEQVISSANLMRETIKDWNGFISRELVYVGDGVFIDIVHWKSLEEAKQAQEKAMESDVCLRFFELIDENRQHIYHGEVVVKQK